VVSKVRYKIPLVPGGRTVEVVTQGMDHIMSLLEPIDPPYLHMMLRRICTCKFCKYTRLLGADARDFLGMWGGGRTIIG
jgi:hypothetical protein